MQQIKNLYYLNKNIKYINNLLKIFDIPFFDCVPMVYAVFYQNWNIFRNKISIKL